MKLLKRQISQKDGSGSILLRPETPEDLWHLYNLLQPNDHVRSTTQRKVVNTTSTGSTTSSKKRLMLTINVQKVDFDPASLSLRISGQTQSESNLVRLGSYHTLNLELNQNIELVKEIWDQIYLDILEEAIHPERQAQVAAVVMQVGLAHVCLIVGSLTLTQARIEVTIPKKRTGSSNHSKAVTKFYNQVYEAILQKVDFSSVKCCLLASPGFVKDDFFQYMMKEAQKREDKVLLEHKSKFVLCRASSGHKHALDEVFADASIQSRLADTKYALETSKLHEFMRKLDTHPDCAYYGYNHVVMADQELAIETLLVTDELFRNSSSLQTRKKYVDLVESVRAHGGQVLILSTMHVSGQQLQQVSGVAAILRFPMPNLEELEELAASHEEEQEEDMSEDEEYDEDARIKEDMADMGLG